MQNKTLSPFLLKEDNYSQVVITTAAVLKIIQKLLR